MDTIDEATLNALDPLHRVMAKELIKTGKIHLVQKEVGRVFNKEASSPAQNKKAVS